MNIKQNKEISNLLAGNLPSDFDGDTYWFDGDTYLSEIIRKEISTFNSEFDLFDGDFHLIPECRAFARKKFLNKDSLEKFLDWCYGLIVEIDLKEIIGLFFWEEIERLFVLEMFAKRFKEYCSTRTREESRDFLVNSMLELKGAKFEVFALQGWE